MESDDSDDIPLCRLNNLKSGDHKSKKTKSEDRNIVPVTEEYNTGCDVIDNSLSLKYNDNASLNPLIFPIVFTKRLEDMDIFRNITVLGSAIREFLIDYVYIESKPKLTANCLGPQRVNKTKSLEQFKDLKQKIKEYNKKISTKVINQNYLNNKRSKRGEKNRESLEPCEIDNTNNRNHQSFLNEFIRKSEDEPIAILLDTSDSDELIEISYDNSKAMSTKQQILNLRLKILNRFKVSPPSTSRDCAKGIEENSTVLVFKYSKNKARSIFHLNNYYNVVESFTTSNSCYKQQIKNRIKQDASIREDICCWYKMEQLSIAISDHLPNLHKHVQDQHRCDVKKCLCCCRPVQKYEIVYNCKNDSISFDIFHIHTEMSRNICLGELIIYFMNSMEKQIELYEITMGGHISEHTITSFSDREIVLKVKERLSSNVKDVIGYLVCCWQRHDYFLKTFLNNKLPKATTADMRKLHKCNTDECKCCCYNLLKTIPNRKICLKFDPYDMKHLRHTKNFNLSKKKNQTELYYEDNRNDTRGFRNFPPNYLHSQDKLSTFLHNAETEIVNDKQESQTIKYKSIAVTKEINTIQKENKIINLTKDIMNQSLFQLLQSKQVLQIDFPHQHFNGNTRKQEKEVIITNCEDHRLSSNNHHMSSIRTEHTSHQKPRQCVSNCNDANETLKTSIDQLLSSIINSKLSNVNQIQSGRDDNQEKYSKTTGLLKAHPELVGRLSKAPNNSSEIKSSVSNCKDANETSIDQLISSIISSKLSNAKQIQSRRDDDQEKCSETTRLLNAHPELVGQLSKAPDNSSEIKSSVSNCKDANETLQTSIEQLLSSIISSQLSNVKQIQSRRDDDQAKCSETTRLLKAHPQLVGQLSKAPDNSSEIKSKVQKKRKTTCRPPYNPTHILKTKKNKIIPRLPQCSPQHRMMTLMRLYNDILKRKKHYLSLSFNCYKSCINKDSGLKKKFVHFTSAINSEGQIIEVKDKVTQTEDNFHYTHNDNTNSPDMKLPLSDIKRKCEEHIPQISKKLKIDNLEQNANVITSNIRKQSDSTTPNPMIVNLPQNNIVLADHASNLETNRANPQTINVVQQSPPTLPSMALNYVYTHDSNVNSIIRTQSPKNAPLNNVNLQKNSILFNLLGNNINNT